MGAPHRQTPSRVSHNMHLHRWVSFDESTGQRRRRTPVCCACFGQILELRPQICPLNASASSEPCCSAPRTPCAGGTGRSIIGRAECPPSGMQQFDMCVCLSRSDKEAQVVAPEHTVTGPIPQKQLGEDPAACTNHHVSSWQSWHGCNYHKNHPHQVHARWRNIQKPLPPITTARARDFETLLHAPPRRALQSISTKFAHSAATSREAALHREAPLQAALLCLASRS